MLLCLSLLPYLHISKLGAIANRFTVRIHTAIVTKGCSWAKLWYFLKGLDRASSGFGSIRLEDISYWLGAGESTIYQWLREGKTAGAFRWWKCQRGILRVALGGLFAVCRQLGLDPDLDKAQVNSRQKFNRAKGLALHEGVKQGFAPWGATAEISLFEISTLQKLRAAGTAAITQRLQQLSRFAAWRSLPNHIRQKPNYRLPQPGDFFQEKQHRQLSDDSASGSLPRCCIHIGKRRVFVSKGFIPFGTSQTAIARERNICDRTVRRHLDLVGIDRRQIVQSKAEYRAAQECLLHDAGSLRVSDEVELWESHSQDGEYRLTERRLGQPYTYKVGEVRFTRIQSRFFTYGKKPKTWLYRCNLYNPTLKLCTMSAARSRHRRYCEVAQARERRAAMLQTLDAPVDVTRCNCFKNQGEFLES